MKNIIKIAFLFYFSLAGFLSAQAKFLISKDTNILYQKTVYFDFNSFSINESEIPVLATIIRAARANDGLFIMEINGHTDFIDNDLYNFELGKKRAESVADYLKKRGLDPAFMKIQSFGKKKSISDNKSEEGRAKNRRVEIVLVKKKNSDLIASGVLLIKGKVIEKSTGKYIPSFITITQISDNRSNNQKIAFFERKSVYSRNIDKGFTYEIHFAADGYKTIVKRIEVKNESLEPIFYVDAELEKLNVKQKLTFKNIYFIPDQPVFRDDAFSDLEKLLAFMQSDSNSVIEIQGHVNFPKPLFDQNPEEREFNYTLSLNRALAVYKYLVNNGISHERLTYKGYGNSRMVKPLATTKSEAMENMRVEVWVLN